MSPLYSRLVSRLLIPILSCVTLFSAINDRFED
jgi:hypothetical protein